MPARQIAFEESDGSRRIRRVAHQRRVELQDGFDLLRHLAALRAKAVLRRDGDGDGVHPRARVSLILDDNATFTDSP